MNLNFWRKGWKIENFKIKSTKITKNNSGKKNKYKIRKYKRVNRVKNINIEIDKKDKQNLSKQKCS